MLSRVILAAKDQGKVLLLPALRDLRLVLTQVPSVTLASTLRNGPRYYRKLGDQRAWKCICSSFPSLPRLPSPDGRLHVFAPQSSWAWPQDLEHLRFMPCHTSAMPSVTLLHRGCRRALDRILDRIGLALGEDLANEIAYDTAASMYASSLVASSTSSCSSPALHQDEFAVSYTHLTLPTTPYV